VGTTLPSSTANWQKTIATHLQARGCKSLLDYLKSNPGKSYLALAQEFGSGVFAMQVIRLAFEEAQLKGQLRWASMDALVRELREAFPNGWGKVYKPVYRSLLTEEQQPEKAEQTEEARIRFQKAKACGAWLAMVGQVPTNAWSHLQSVWDALEHLSPPIGWLPKDPDDPLILAAFEKGWPVSAKIELLPVGPHLICPKCGAVILQPAETDLDQTCPHCGTKFPLP
jgi:hypothetical protein